MRKIIFTSLFLMALITPSLAQDDVFQNVSSTFESSSFGSFDAGVAGSKTNSGTVVLYAAFGGGFLTLAFVLVIGGFLYYRYKYREEGLSQGISKFSK